MMLDRSGTRTRLGELLVIWLIAGLALLLLAWVLAGLLGVLIVLVLLFVVPPAALQGCGRPPGQAVRHSAAGRAETDGQFTAGRLFPSAGPRGCHQAIA